MICKLLKNVNKSSIKLRFVIKIYLVFNIMIDKIYVDKIICKNNM